MLIKLLRNVLGGVARPKNRTTSAITAALTRCFDEGDLERAQLLCDSILKEDREDPTALYVAGVISHRHGDAATALDLLARAVRVSSDPRAALSLARVLQDLGRDEEALNYHLRALNTDPQIFDAHLAAGIIFFQKTGICEGGASFS